MHRLTVALLAAFDAVVAAAAGLAVALATLTAMFLVGFGEGAQWSSLWPSAASVWQVGNLVPLSITLPDAYLAATGIPADAAAFTFSLAPLAFAVFTAVFAARSGARAAAVHAWIPGVVVGGGVYAALAAGVALTSVNPVAQPVLWQAVLFPGGLYVVAAAAGAVRTGWIAGGDGLIDAMRNRTRSWTPPWRQIPGLLARGSAIVVMCLIGSGAAVVAVAIVAGGGEIIALSEAAHLDALGATMTALGALAYLPTLVIWGMSWVVGPGFALGTGTSVGPGGTQVGVVPGLPVLGALPGTLTGWLLLVVLVPVAAGAFAGWVQRSRFVRTLDAAPGTEPYLPRVVLTVGTAALAAVAAAALAALGSGALGPGRFVEIGPGPGPVALAVGLEVLVGAAILLLSPRWRPRGTGPASLVESHTGRDADLAPSDPEPMSDPDESPTSGPARSSAAVIGADAVGRPPGAASAVTGLAPDGDRIGESTDEDDTVTAPLEDDPPTGVEPVEPGAQARESRAAHDPPSQAGDDEDPDGKHRPPASRPAVDPATLGRHRPRPLPPVD